MIRTKNTVIERFVTISLNNLKLAGLFDRSNLFKTILLNISKSNKKYRIWVTMIYLDDKRYIELSYEINNVSITSKVELIEVEISLTKSIAYFFLCPVTSKKCRKLYLIGTTFQHRKAAGNIYYLQTLSKKERQQYKGMKKIHSLEQAIAQRTRKHYKSHYWGRYTQRHKMVMAAYKELQRIAV